MRAFACGKKRHGQTKRIVRAKAILQELEERRSEKEEKELCGDNII